MRIIYIIININIFYKGSDFSFYERGYIKKAINSHCKFEIIRFDIHMKNSV